MADWHPETGYAEVPRDYDDGSTRVDLDSLSSMAYSNGQTWWAYKAPMYACWAHLGYFDGAANLLRPGDLIVITGRGAAAERADDVALGAMRLVARTMPHVVLAKLG